MAVYVDDMRAKFGRMIMCHMIADTDEELHAMADKIGINRKWHQLNKVYTSHYDICLSMRDRAVALGAIQITWKQAGAMCAIRRMTGELGNPSVSKEQYLAARKKEKEGE